MVGQLGRLLCLLFIHALEVADSAIVVVQVPLHVSNSERVALDVRVPGVAHVQVSRDLLPILMAFLLVILEIAV